MSRVHFLLIISVAAPALGVDFFKSLGKGITKEITAIKQPIDETIAFVGSSQCSNVKKIIGVSYEQLEGDKEPDLNQLTLVYRDQSVRTVYNITTAATRIVNSPEFHPRQKLIIFIHGFTDDPTKNSFSNISDAFLMQGECNVLALDGSSLIHWLYLRSTTYVRFMGEKLGEVLLASMVRKGLDPAAIHIIGHSLGSHIAGFTGKTFQNLTGMKIGRISGLDPAGPCFSEVEPDLRLKATDADFVDVMHTDAGVYGLKEDVGDVDFYPNGGSQQPDCFFQTCSHSRTWLLYSESVLDPHAFPAVKCSSWDGFKKGECNYKDISYMGYHAKPSMTGAYYLQTGGEDAHFGLHQRGLKFNNTQGVIKNLGDKAKDLGEQTQALFG